MRWIDRVKANIFPVSEEQADVRRALREWTYFGNVYDLGRPEASCELCDFPAIRYRFEIVNRLNSNVLFIGSECITRFDDIDVLDEFGEILSVEAARRKVRSDKGRLIAEGKQRYVLRILVLLAQRDRDFDINSFIEYFQDRGAFTPKQLVTLMWRFQRHGIAVYKPAFKMIMRRNREKDQLDDMPTDQLRMIWHCLSSRQKTCVEFIVASRGELKVQKNKNRIEKQSRL